MKKKKKSKSKLGWAIYKYMCDVAENAFFLLKYHVKTLSILFFIDQLYTYPLESV